MAGVDYTYWANEKAMRPIPVAERLPTKADCDRHGRCWLFDTHDEAWLFDQYGPLSANEFWLPAAAIPLPEGEP